MDEAFYRTSPVGRRKNHINVFQRLFFDP